MQRGRKIALDIFDRLLVDKIVLHQHEAQELILAYLRTRPAAYVQNKQSSRDEEIDKRLRN